MGFFNVGVQFSPTMTLALCVSSLWIPKANSQRYGTPFDAWGSFVLDALRLDATALNHVVLEVLFTDSSKGQWFNRA